MKGYLLIDFGSTYTKLTAIDISKEEIIATAKAYTTVDTDIMIGFNRAYEKLEREICGKDVHFIKKLACSSAAGGLKMVALGLVNELTSEAAKRAALGAGARVLKVYSNGLTKKEAEEIKNSNIDIILLAGGTDGGNKECILDNAAKLASMNINIPVVVAGNKMAEDEVEEIFKEKNIYYKTTENVMPKLNELNVEPAREIIRQIFMEKIVEAKGLKKAEELVNGILMPTPAAVLNAARVLSVGSDKEEGIGDLIVVDIGGATTDVHSIGKGEPTKIGVNFRGLEEPFSKRTVEGDLGMRYSALSLFEAAGTRKIEKYLKSSEIDIKAHCEYRAKNTDMLPENSFDIEFDEAMAKTATELSLNRHVGFIENIYTPMGIVYNQIGKDLLEVKYMIGTGGVLVHSENPSEILKAGTYSLETSQYLKPKNPKFLLDKSYIMSAMGLLATEDEDMAVRMMKRYIINV